MESRVRENRTHGSEGGEGESLSLPLSLVTTQNFLVFLVRSKQNGSFGFTRTGTN